MHVGVGVWVITCVAIAAVFVFDFVNNARSPHEPTFRESAQWSAFYVVLAVVFGLLVWWHWGPESGVEFFAGISSPRRRSRWTTCSCSP